VVAEELGSPPNNNNNYDILEVASWVSKG
jgi:hypothetical protein